MRSDETPEVSNNFESEIMAIDYDLKETELDINTFLRKESVEQIKQIIFDEYLNPNIETKPHDEELKIRLTADTPFRCTPSRLSQPEREALQKTTDEYLKKGIIRPSNSPFACKVVMTKKKNGEYRKCVNYRPQNKITSRDNYPLPLIDDCLEFLGGKKYFSTIDLKNGYFHVKVAEESKRYTSFVTPYGQFEYNYMSFGLMNAPAVFQRFINNASSDLISASKIIVYMDRHI